MKRSFLILAFLLAILTAWSVYRRGGLSQNNPPLTAKDSSGQESSQSASPPGGFSSENNPKSGAALGGLSVQKVIVPDQFKSGVFAGDHSLDVPDGFSVGVFAAGLGKARGLAFSSEDSVFVTDLSGRVLLLRDENLDGVAEKITTIDQKLDNPHGIDLFENDLYVGEESRVVVYRGIKNDGSYEKKEILISGLPSGRGHATRTVHIGPDRKIYVHVGSSCNICEETDPRRATVLRYNLDGSFDRVIGSGLRNTVGFTFKNTGENSFELWGVDNGRDRIGDNLPSEEVNLIYSSGQTETKNFGWPYCYGKGIANPEFFSRTDYCQAQTEFPRYEMQAHSAPLGISFIPDDEQLPQELQGNMLITFHGSWNRSVPTGYKIVRIDPSGSGETVDFVNGWLDDNGQVWGRPVDLKFSSSGSLYVSDDQAGAVYLIRPSS